MEERRVVRVAAFVLDQRNEVAESIGRPHRGGAECLDDPLHFALVVELEQGKEQIVLALEVRIHGALGEPGDTAHLIERCPVEALLGEDLGRRCQEVLAGQLTASVLGEGFEGHGCATHQNSKY